MGLAIQVAIAALVIAGFAAAMWAPIVMYLRRAHQRVPRKAIAGRAIRCWAAIAIAGAGLALIAFVAVLVIAR